eukprot:CAMPEP_0114551626 /NCGR_PEP_ID=MMETSP0114-20121206/6704_1 /TAXON_ID=31324 /ORGANISM="Goniomonas sp, Strain m" /LENGTH=266 /DNA_ID=CAMNT_0001736473 /DNA_START=99 /DNA_END=899 /DNA_ORIENTATION=-
MATQTNFFALLDDDADVDSRTVVKPVETKKAAPVAAKPAEKKPAARPNSARNAPARQERGEDPTHEPRGGRGGGGGGNRGGRGGAGGRPPKREFERHSGTGRGKEVSKNGAGANNWGQEGVEKDDVPVDRTADAEVEDGEASPEKVKVEKEISVEEYYRNLEAQRQGLTAPTPRKVTADKPEKGLQVYTKDEEDAFAALAVAKSSGGKKSSGSKKKPAPAAGFFAEPRPQGRGRGDRPQDNRNTRGPRQSMPSTTDMSAFPALGAA